MTIDGMGKKAVFSFADLDPSFKVAEPTKEIETETFDDDPTEIRDDLKEVAISATKQSLLILCKQYQLSGLTAKPKEEIIDALYAHIRAGGKKQISEFTKMNYVM